METHAHHLHKAPGKNFWHYFFEFFMLFLAVFCGFLAENTREHFIEKHKEKEYMMEVVENIKYDTTRINRNYRANQELFLGMDSLREELKQAINGHIDGNKLYYLEKKYASQYNEVVFNTSAITELKNSGSLRLIRNKKLVEDIADYYERRISAVLGYIPSTNSSEKLKTDLNEYFSWLYFDDYIKTADSLQFQELYNYNEILSRNPALQLLKSKPEDLLRLYNIISQREYNLKAYCYFMIWARGPAIKLINDIKNEYHLE